MTSKTVSKLLWFLLIVVGLTVFLFATLSLFLSFQWALMKVNGDIPENVFYSQMSILGFSLFDGFIIALATCHLKEVNVDDYNS
ncbi:hypothetical protein DDV21_005410 [Streptococcus chenjunshii]|uniref:Uncharacterized protein n=1 Tax=Streptococcus chenjunshii TaxID=2173853 RepID=A0A372KPJ3_9STRE|nr:hypothetical protein [Streptococcus chenjunshii]AXQ78557.1 hypothetical protein DDV21_005410 [Streptococcus chenjunshii]RFU51981.1 hypothetical protein DDV22_00635 [Streptococcus chenjunshii]RFU54173.1 hypothetical protein DDV23_01190 [Streptococcus chenjunshii]